ncbi:MAG TPA: hypothetical protein VI407_08055 [Erythrobacter sp.]
MPVAIPILPSQCRKPALREGAVCPAAEKAEPGEGVLAPAPLVAARANPRRRA